LPERKATLHNNAASVSGPEYSKLRVVGLTVLQAWSHSRWWPVEFGMVGAGRLKFAYLASGSGWWLP
jgi:hypothetical protein